MSRNRIAAPVAVAAAALASALLSAPVRAQGPAHGEDSARMSQLGKQSDFQAENAPRDAFERKLMTELRCMCDCAPQSIAACKCKFAAKMRGKVLAMLKGNDLSTPAGRHRVEKQVLHAFAAEYGDDVLKPPLDASQAGLGWLPIALFGGALLVVVILARRSKRRRRDA